MTFNQYLKENYFDDYGLISLSDQEINVLEDVWNAAIKAAVLAWEQVESPENTYSSAQKERKAMEALLTS